MPIDHPVNESITIHHTHAVLKLPRGEAPDYHSQISLPIMSRLGKGVHAGTSQAAPIAYYPASTYQAPHGVTRHPLQVQALPPHFKHTVWPTQTAGSKSHPMLLIRTLRTEYSKNSTVQYSTGSAVNRSAHGGVLSLRHRTHTLTSCTKNNDVQNQNQNRPGVIELFYHHPC